LNQKGDPLVAALIIPKIAPPKVKNKNMPIIQTPTGYLFGFPFKESDTFPLFVTF
jgi:hypothetical protein